MGAARGLISETLRVGWAVKNENNKNHNIKSQNLNPSTWEPLWKHSMEPYMGIVYGILAWEPSMGTFRGNVLW